MNIVKINPLRPFEKMSRMGDFEEMVTNAFTHAFDLSPTLGRVTLSVAIHHAYAKHGIETILSDVVEELKVISADETNVTMMNAARDLTNVLSPYACDSSFPEYAIFCDRDGHPLNSLDVTGLKMVMMQSSNDNIRAFLERMVIYSLLF